MKSVCDRYNRALDSLLQLVRAAANCSYLLLISFVHCVVVKFTEPVLWIILTASFSLALFSDCFFKQLFSSLVAAWILPPHSEAIVLDLCGYEVFVRGRDVK